MTEADKEFPAAIVAGEEHWWIAEAQFPGGPDIGDHRLYVRGDLVKQLIESARAEVSPEEGMGYGPSLEVAIAGIPPCVWLEEDEPAEGKRWRYRAMLRPVSGVTLPPDPAVQAGWTFAHQPGTACGGTYGVIELPRELTASERDRYGLRPE